MGPARRRGTPRPSRAASPAAEDEDDGVVELGEAARRSPFEADCAEEEEAAAAAAAATAAAVEFTRSVLACGPDRDGSGRFFMTGLCGG